MGQLLVGTDLLRLVLGVCVWQWVNNLGPEKTHVVSRSFVIGVRIYIVGPHNCIFFVCITSLGRISKNVLGEGILSVGLELPSEGERQFIWNWNWGRSGCSVTMFCVSF